MNVFFIYSFLIVLGVVFPKSKFIFSLQWILFTVAIAFNRGGPDVEAYQAMYTINGQLNDFSIKPEVTYQYLSHLFYQMGFSFDDLTMVTSILAMFILGWTIWRTTPFVALIMGLIFIFPGLDFIIQKRNFLGVCFLLLGFSYLIQDVKYFRIKYLLCVIIATGFHSLFILYSLVIFIPKVWIKIFESNRVFFISSLLCIAPLIPNIANLFMSSSKFELYFNNSELILSFYKVLFFIIMQLLFVLLCVRIIDLYIIDKRLIFWGKVFCYFSLIVLPFYFYGSTFVRLYKNLVPIFYIIIFYSGHGLLDVVSLKLNRNYFLILIFILAQAFVAYGLGAGWEAVAKPLFEQNPIFRFVNF